MKKYSGGYLRIAFFIIRPTKSMRDWFDGTMRYTRHNTKWFVRVFELGNGITEALLDFGSLRPDGIMACGFGSLSRAKIAFRQKFGMSMRDYRKKAKG